MNGDMEAQVAYPRKSRVGQMTGMVDEKELGAIMSRLVRVEKVGQLLDSKVNMLDNKLSHILSGVPLKGSGLAGGECEGTPIAPLANRLEQLYDTLASISNHVDQLIDRVDI